MSRLERLDSPKPKRQVLPTRRGSSDKMPNGYTGSIGRHHETSEVQGGVTIEQAENSVPTQEVGNATA